jgi:phosphatidylglycerophosphate synthase
MHSPRAISQPPRERADRGPWPRGTGPAVGLAAAAIVVAAALVDRWLGADGTLLVRALVLALCGGGLVLYLAAKHLTTARFGAANAVTLVRAALTLLLLALLGAGASAPLAWLIVALAVVAVCLDGVDGALARRRGEGTAFGARFDMETDAWLIVVLTALVWQQGKAGAWILLAGLLRYLFVAASYVWPALGRALPPSRRRQTVCVVQIVSLIAALLPPVPLPWSAGAALAGLALLVWSFGLDVAWLARRARL